MQLVLLQQQRHGIFNAHIAHEDGGLHVRTHVLVEDEVEPGHLRQHLEDGFQVGVTKLQGYRAFHLGPQLRVGLRGAALYQLDVLAQGQAILVLRIEQEHFAHVPLGAEQIALTQRRLAEGHALIDVADLFDLAYRFLGAAVVGFQGQHPPIAHPRALKVMAAAVAVGLGQQRFNRLTTALDHGNVQLGVAWILLECLLEHGDTCLVLPFSDQRLAILAHATGAATGQGNAKCKHQVWRLVAVPGRNHGALPTDNVWDKCNGR
ncbi:hypothetical protein D9M71_476770 [compost metagenome]